MFDGPIFYSSIFYNFLNEIDQIAVVVVPFDCKGRNCTKCKNNCATWKFTRGLNSISRAYLPAIVICNQRYDLCQSGT